MLYPHLAIESLAYETPSQAVASAVIEARLRGFLSRLKLPLFERGTGRNLNTIEKLVELAEKSD